jgi:hypothetical protein
MRKLLYLLFAMILLGHLQAASACRFFTGSKQHPGSPEEQLFEIASTVFVGHVIRTEEAEPLRDHKYGTTTHTYAFCSGGNPKNPGMAATYVDDLHLRVADRFLLI